MVDAVKLFMDSQHSSPTTTVSDYQKASERLAAERTFLAWIRTSISIISLGFVVAKFGVWLRELADRLQPGTQMHKTAASLPIGVGLMAVGGALAILALWHYHAVNKAIDEDNVGANRGLVTTVAIAVALLAAVIIIYLFLTTRNE
jgi:putative membrane protein